MPRPKSDHKREAIIAAATRVIVAQGLSAPTAGIAKEAGIANGSLFTYFETKSELFNAVYLELKLEMACAVVDGFRERDDLRKQVFHVWKNWIGWHWLISACPTKSRLRRGEKPIREWQLSLS